MLGKVRQKLLLGECCAEQDLLIARCLYLYYRRTVLWAYEMYDF